MKLKKIISLVDIASIGINVPEKIKIETMDIDKAVYLQEDTLIPVFIYFANVLSKNIYGKPIINISLKKSQNTLCYSVLEEKEDTEEDHSDADSVKILFLMESIHQIMGLEYSQEPDLTLLVKNWRKNLEKLKEGEEIQIGYEVEKLIIDHLPYFKTKNENKLT